MAKEFINLLIQKLYASFLYTYLAIQSNPFGIYLGTWYELIKFYFFVPISPNTTHVKYIPPPETPLSQTKLLYVVVLDFLFCSLILYYVL